MWWILRMWSVGRCDKKGHNANKCQEVKTKDSKGSFKVKSGEEPVSEKAVDETKSIRLIRIRFLDIYSENDDPFIR